MIKLDKVALADCFTPADLVQEIFTQCPTIKKPPIPVEGIAKAVGIIEILPLPSSPLEGMLVADSGKDKGVIYYKSDNILGRRRFTIGHELGHFLMLTHGSKQHCSPKDLRTFKTSATDKSITIEAEANEFSADLLMPLDKVQDDINSKIPTLEFIDKLADLYQVSFEPMANRCSSTSNHPIAMVYVKDGKIRYVWRDYNKFPERVSCKTGDTIPLGSHFSGATYTESTISQELHVEGNVWIENSYYASVPEIIIEQSFMQEDGFQIIMLRIDR